MPLAPAEAARLYPEFFSRSCGGRIEPTVSDVDELLACCVEHKLVLPALPLKAARTALKSLMECQLVEARVQAARAAAWGKAGAVTCKSGHELGLYVRKTLGANNCNGGCGRRGINPPEKIYRCEVCDFDLCMQCYSAEAQPSENKPKQCIEELRVLVGDSSAVVRAVAAGALTRAEADKEEQELSKEWVYT